MIGGECAGDRAAQKNKTPDKTSAQGYPPHISINRRCYNHNTPAGEETHAMRITEVTRAMGKPISDDERSHSASLEQVVIIGGWALGSLASIPRPGTRLRAPNFANRPEMCTMLDSVTAEKAK